MKRTLCSILILAIVIVLPGSGLPAGQRTLTGVFEPEMITVAEDVLYIVEGGHVLAYSLKDLRLLRKIGGQGEGPGEFRPADYWYNTVTVLPEEIFVDGHDKIVRFSKEGRLRSESRKPLGVSRMAPVGKNFAAVKLDHLEGEVQYQCLLLYDANGTLIRELARQESPVQSMTRKTEMIPDVLNFAVWEDGIFVEKSREGFVIDVFDGGGSLQYRIEKKHEKIAVTEDHEHEALERLKTDPFVKRIGFEQFRQFSQFVWPKTLPAIKDFTVDDGRIYVRTSRMRDGKENWLILDLAGDILGDADLSPLVSPPLTAALYGVHYFSIDGNKLYSIKDNEKTDEWELFVEEIKSEDAEVRKDPEKMKAEKSLLPTERRTK
jgi:hypothetical protein